jgi:putative ABC transport system permease protein
MYKNYFKIALKVLLRRKMFTFISLFGICFTLSILLAATAVYTSLVVSNPVEKKLSRTLFLNNVMFWNREKSTCTGGSIMAYLIESSVKPLANTEMISICSSYCETVTTYIVNERIDIDVKETDENFYKVLNLIFLEGRPYSKNDIETGQKVAVICQSLSKRYFGNQSPISKSITLENESYQIIGVVKDVPKLYQTAYAQIWTPYNYASYMSEVQNKKYGNWAYSVMIVAKNKSDFKPIQNQFSKQISWLKPPENFYSTEAKLKSSFDLTFGGFLHPEFGENKDYLKKISAIIFILILFLLLPLLNLTNLTISRIFERSSEIGVRKAFGATKRQMTAQFLYENLIVTILGGVLGFGGAWLLLIAINVSGIMEIGSISISFTILLYGFLVILAFGIISGMYPALKMSKLHIVDIMKGGNK